MGEGRRGHLSAGWSGSGPGEEGERWLDSGRLTPRHRFRGGWGSRPKELDSTGGRDGCPDIWELDNGDVAVIGRDLTGAYRGRLPEGVTVAADERIVVIPHRMIVAAKPDIPDA